MGFRPPWTAFTPGDLVYGVEEVSFSLARRSYLDSIFQGGLTIEDFQIIGADTPRSPVSKAARRSFIGALREHGKFASSIGAPGSNEDIRRKDKGGLMWAAKTGRTVHFVLDGLDMVAVVRKSFRNPIRGGNSDRPARGDKPKDRSVTGSELRWIYRNRHLPDVQRCVQFWFNKTQVCPPWETYYTLDWSTEDGTMLPQAGAGLWSNYVPRGAPAEAL